MEYNSSEKYEVIAKENDYQVAINDSFEENYVSQINVKKEKKREFPFIFYIFLLTLILFIGAVIALLIISYKYDKNYSESDQDIYVKQSISDHNYSKLVFNNGLEIVLIQVHYNDTAGGAISFEKGYLDQEYLPGYLKLAFYSLRNTDINSSRYLNYYMGNLQLSTEEFYSTISFNILNSGFGHYLSNFTNKISFDAKKDNVTDLLKNGTRRIQNSIPINIFEEKEKHLLEFLVYGIVDKNGNDVWRQCVDNGAHINISLINTSHIKDIMIDLFNPGKVKMVFYSHYKIPLMKKMVIKNVNSLSNLIKLETNEEKTNEYYSNLNTGKVIYHQIKEDENHYIKIIYYINGNNSSLKELYKDSGYFNYIKYILDETHNESLYYKLTHSENNNAKLNIKSLSCNFEVILKSKIKFSILIKLNEYSYEYLKEIIERVYSYMEKIKMHINNLKQNDERVTELYTINAQNFTFTEDSHEIGYYKNKAKDLFYRDDKDYYLKEVWIPSDLNQSNSRIKFYSNQLTQENSVIFVSISKQIVDKYHLNESLRIFSDLKKTTKYSNITYSIHDIKDLNLYIDKVKKENSLTYYPNIFISNFSRNDKIVKEEEKLNGTYTPLNKSDNFVKFYWIKSTNFEIPKVYVNLYFFHPYLRPNTKNKSEQDTIFFYFILYMAYLEREIYFKLSDAIRAGNMIKMNFTENFFYIDVFAYSDKIIEIMTIINDIVYSNEDNIKTEIKDNFILYRDYALDDLLNFQNLDIKEVLRYEYYKGITENDKDDFPPVYNYYKFNKTNFINITESNCSFDYLNNINAQIVNGFILGYCERNKAEEIYNISKRNFNELSLIQSFYHANYNPEKFPIKSFVNKSLNREKLTENKPNNKAKELLSNVIYSFMTFGDYSYENRILAELLKKVLEHNTGRRSYRIDIINQKDIVLRFFIPRQIYINTSEFINSIIDIIKSNQDYYTNEHFDVVGDYFYYIVTNLEIKFSKNPISMKGSAIAFSYDELYDMHNVHSYKIDRDDYDNFTKTIELIINENSKYFEFSNVDMKDNNETGNGIIM